MKHGWRSWIIAGVIATGIAGWVIVHAPAAELMAPSARIAPPSVPQPRPVETNVATPEPPLIDTALPTVASISGHPLNTDGLDVASFLAKVTPAARRGDAVAAYRAYQAEATCAWRDRLMRMDMSTNDADDQTRHVAYLAQLTATCAGVTPAQIGERFGFLAQAIRAGNDRAVIDYRVEGPNGLELTDFDPHDPLLLAWRKDSNAYLEQLASKGNHDAWVLLAVDYENGIVVDRDLGAALTYWSAIELSRKPEIDPLSIGFINDMAKQLTAADVQQAIAQGRVLGTQFPRKHRAA